MRQANAVDFWRGVALLTIFVNHVPGIWWEFATHRNVSWSDSADLFVFLAGWSVAQLAASGKETPFLLVLRLLGRAVTLYAVQIFLTALAISFIAGAAYVFENPLILEWHNAAAVFAEPVTAHLGIVLLTHQLGYFDILPLYVVLMLMTPAIVLIDHYARAALVPVSLLIYVAVLTTSANLPTWPVQGVWFFNPLAWQAVFVLGFAIGRDVKAGGPTVRIARILRWPAVACVALVAYLQRIAWGPDPLSVPEPALFFIIDKTFVTPLRLLQFLTLVIAFSAVFPYLLRFVPWATSYFAALGRNSLYVFCVGSLASLAAQLLRFIFGSGFVVDTLIVLGGAVSLGVTAWVVEWRERIRSQRQSVVS